MFRKLYNQASFTAGLRPDGPLLIVQGGAAIDPMAPDLAFVRSVHQGIPTVYLPGSSIKGVLRAHAERLLATIVGEAAAEDPFDFGTPRRKAAHAAGEKENRNTAGVYQLSCEADRLFGSTEIAGRLRVADAYPTSQSTTAANRTEVRYGVAINRMKQSVQVGPFEQEAVTSGEFALKITIENFDLWMLSLVLQVLRDLNEGLIQVGHAKSRGYGSVQIENPALKLRWVGERPARLAGAGARERSEEVRGSYGLDADDEIDFPAGAALEEDGLFSTLRLAGWDAIRPVQSSLAGESWQRFVKRASAGASHGQ